MQAHQAFKQLFLVAVTVALLGSSIADAEEPFRVRGTLQKVDGDRLVVLTREGEVMGLAMAKDAKLFVTRPATLDDIKKGQFIGITSIESGGERVALEAHLFPEDMRGVGEGHYPWDLVEEPNAMTNATIAEVKAVGDERLLQVAYAEGEGEQKVEGTQTIVVPPGVPIVRLEETDQRDLLQPGRQVFLIVRPERDLTPVVTVAVVGDYGTPPPM